MRFVTHCPTCGTSFKVVPDQLRIAQGWVRCGQCQTVYKADDKLELEEQVLAQPRRLQISKAKLPIPIKPAKPAKTQTLAQPDQYLQPPNWR